MPDNPMKCTVTVDAPPRSSAVQAFVQFSPSEVVITKSWGLQPATALIDWVSATSQPSIIPLASMTIEVGGHTFYGICKSLVPVRSSQGNSMMQEFVDSREFLMWDVAYCAFNQRMPRIINGRYARRYSHILPSNFNSRTRTFTDAPLTARQILDYLFTADTVESPWSRTYHQALDNPVFELDFTSGRKLGLAVQEISERMGLTFTLAGGRYSLVWAMKGVGSVPAFPSNSENRRLGEAVSGNPTRVRLLGERNQYQILDCPLVPDWRPAWEQFADVNLLQHDIFNRCSTEAASAGIPAGTRYNAIPGDTGQQIGTQLANARVRTVTVAEYAALRADDAFLDFRKYDGRSRLGMPAWLYVAELLFKAFRLPPDFTVTLSNGLTASLSGLEISSQGLVSVSHDPVTGAMNYDAFTPSESNGYAIARGYQVASDSFGTLRPEYFDINNWITRQALWQAIPFQTDSSGEGDQFFLFREAVIVSADIIQPLSVSGTLQTYADGRAKTSVAAGATITIPAVRAAVTFTGESFSHVAGTGTRDDVVNLGGLGGEFVGRYGAAGLTELALADGDTASTKAGAIAATLLNRQFYYGYGGYTVQGSNATQLTPVIDRVTVRWNSGGLTEDVDFTNERARNVSVGAFGQSVLHVEPEREFERRSQLSALFPSQSELRTEARQANLAAAAFQSNPALAVTIVDEFLLLSGQSDVSSVRMATHTALVPAGTPLIKATPGNQVAAPDGTAVVGGTFAGVTVVHNEDPAGLVRVATKGTVLALVQGPVARNAVVGFADAAVATPQLAAAPALPVGIAQEAIADTSIKIIPVALGSGGGTGWHWKSPDPEIDVTAATAKDTVIFTSPSSALVQNGMRDLISDTLTRCPPGTWIAMKDVPAAVTVAGVLKYNVPKLLPTTGANLLSGGTVFWHLLQEHNPCIGM